MHLDIQLERLRAEGLDAWSLGSQGQVVGRGQLPTGWVERVRGPLEVSPSL